MKEVCLLGFAAPLIRCLLGVVPGSLQPRQESVASALLCLIAELGPKKQGYPGTSQAKPYSLLTHECG